MASPAPAPPPNSTQLELVSGPQPDYPLEAAAKRLQGRVWIKLHISETGDVERTEIVSGDPILAKAAAKAMQAWKFKPFFKDGKPVKVSKQVPFDFSVKGFFPDGCSVAAAAALANSAHHLLIDQKVMDGYLLRRVEPQYPAVARTLAVQGTVVVHAVIGDDGRIQDLKIVCGRPELIPASVQAIRQWRFRPYTLNGQAVAVETDISVSFSIK